jgi:exodeoxyribonuclease-1
MAHTFFWHDYETFGAQPRYDRPAQFAGIRTDDQLNEIGEPVMWYCQPANDYLPDPQSCLITGITPQRALEEGVAEHEFAALIEAELAQAGTVGVGYNTIRFDDEITRFMFWRNLIDPYAREWQNGCGRWDLLDVVRMVYALRPDGIQWPTKEDGTPSFKLEDLARANGLLHEQAHDALSDVRATIALARLIREKQPRLFDFAFGLHKRTALCARWACPPRRSTRALSACDRHDQPRAWLSGRDVAAGHPPHQQERSHLLGSGGRPGRAFGHQHRGPAPASVHASGRAARGREPSAHQEHPRQQVAHGGGKPQDPEPAMAEKWGVDMELAMQHAAIARDLPDMSAQWKAVFTREAGEPLDADQDLYGGFVGNEDRRRLERIKRLSPQELALDKTGFDDARLTELVWRYRARNFPQTLDAGEQQRWEQHRAACLIEGQGGARTAEQMFAMIDALSESVDERGEEILGELYDYASNLVPEG